MKFSRPRVPPGLPIAALVLLVLGLLAGPLIRANFSEEQLADNVMLNAIPFILIFISIILVYIIIVWAAVTSLNDNVPRRIYRPVELALMAGIALGVAGMFQPWVQSLFPAGFYLLLFSTLGFILWTHIRPKGQQRRQAVRGLDIGEFEEREAPGTRGN